MIHYLVGDLGHVFVIVAFVASLASTVIYLKARRTEELELKKAWLINARTAFTIHALATVGIIVALFIIIQRHYFEYHYAFSHSSLNLAPEYMIACFWEGQEGSFLLWMSWQALLGMILIFKKDSWEPSVKIGRAHV